MKEIDFILWFKDLRKEDISYVGGKCANLGELIGKVKVSVPGGFAISSYAYQYFLEQTGAGEKIDALISGLDYDDLKSLQTVSQEIRKHMEKQSIPQKIEKAIIKAYQMLCKKAGEKEMGVAVRSSATAEDLPGASFAGQQDTFLNVTRASLLKRVKQCWSSLFTPRAMVYRKEKGFFYKDVSIGVAVQEMIAARTSGVMFTLEPVTGDKDKIMINASWGLGEAVVSGKVTPDEYLVDKKSLKILDKHIFKKEKK